MAQSVMPLRNGDHGSAATSPTGRKSRPRWSENCFHRFASALSDQQAMISTRYYRRLYQIEHLISDTVKSCYPRAWEENHISYSWMEALKRLTGIVIDDPPTRFSVAWDAYKADGGLEEEQGDIVFLVRVSFAHAGHCEGVAFLEAKRAYQNGAYQKVNWEQLRHQCARSANHRLLLYDFEASADVVRNMVSQSACYHDWYPHCVPAAFNRCHAFTGPTQHALALNAKNRTLSTICYPLSYQIVSRYLRGLDLDYTPNLVKAVRNGVVGGIRFIFVAHTALGGDIQPSVQSLELQFEGFSPVNADQRPETPNG